MKVRVSKKSRVSIQASKLLVILLLYLVSSCSKDDISGYKYENITELLSQTIANNNIPGMIAAIADSNGIMLIESAGVRKIGSTELITVNDHFHLGSCTKAMTSALMATLVAENKIQWETTLIEVFPELKDSILSMYHNITLHQLLTHRSGLVRDASFSVVYNNPEISERRYLYMKNLLKRSTDFNPGEFLYSNLGYSLAGVMAERIGGENWETLITSRIFEPLEMYSAGFGPPGTLNNIEQPWGHSKSNGEWQASQLDNPPEIGPAGTVHCAIEDWANFLVLFLKQGNTKILERDLLDKLVDPIGDYACGWGVRDRSWANGTTFTHSGSNTMWYVNVWVAPEINRAFIVGTNSKNENTDGVCDKVTGNLIRIDQNMH